MKRLTRTEKAIEALKAARLKDLNTPPKRLSTKYKHYKNTTSVHERAIRAGERINRNAPMKTIKADGTVIWTNPINVRAFSKTIDEGSMQYRPRR